MHNVRRLLFRLCSFSKRLFGFWFGTFGALRAFLEFKPIHENSRLLTVEVKIILIVIVRMMRNMVVCRLPSQTSSSILWLPSSLSSSSSSPSSSSSSPSSSPGIWWFALACRLPSQAPDGAMGLTWHPNFALKTCWKFSSSSLSTSWFWSWLWSLSSWSA